MQSGASYEIALGHIKTDRSCLYVDRLIVTDVTKAFIKGCVLKMLMVCAWLLTLQLTMVAPCRLMVQVVLLPLSMGTTGVWHAML